MLTLLSVLTSAKDYVDIVHTFMDHDPMWSEIMTTYFDPGAILAFCFLFCKELLIKIFTFGWLPNFAALPSLVPEVTRSMLTELSVFDTPALRFSNMFTFLDTPISYGPQNVVFYSLEKFIIGLINSVFFCLPTSFAHMVCMRRFVMQGVEAGYYAGLGTIAGNLVWISCIVLGLRSFVIPWVALDTLRYAIGVALVFKYLWDSYRDRRLVLTRVDEFDIMVFNFCLAFLEQSMVFPFISNLSIGSDATLIESFPTGHIVSFFLVHFAYLGGLLLGSLTLLQGACWFWENPAFSLYMWTLSTFKISALTYYRLSNFFFLYASMFFAMANLAYFGTDYLVTKPLGFLPNDRLISNSDEALLETSYLGVKGSSRNTRLNEGRHNRRERWKRRHKRFRMFDTALYDDGIYDLFTIEDLNYGFHKFWLRRKMRNHRSNYRVLPTKQVRAFKQEAARSKLEGFMGPRFEFTRMLFENAYHPTFHRYQTNQQPQKAAAKAQPFNVLTGNQVTSAYAMDKKIQVTESLRHNNSALRKFVRKLKLRLKGMPSIDRAPPTEQSTNPLYSKRWRHLFSRIYHRQLRRNTSVYQLLTRDALFFGEGTPDYEDSLIPLSERDRQLVRYKSAIKGEFKDQSISMGTALQTKPLNAVHPLSFYLKREEAFKRKLLAYGPNVSRTHPVGTNLHVFSPMSQRLFYYHKPNNRWERAMQVARVTRKRVRNPRYQEVDVSDPTTFKADWENIDFNEREKKNPYRFTYPTDYLALISKRAGRIRHQIFKDVLQHWYYSPYNRFLLQWDMDSFIRRQPRSYFMNKEDEKQLHLRRVLLNDYFQTFRWYARMDQYHIMKQRIGGTKSFRSRVYNQQFQGTFKKVRHLFAVTPTLETQPILKFDQPLFNEYPNTTKSPITAQSFIHEELNLEPNQKRGLSRELWDQAAMALALALTDQENYRNNYTQLLTNEDQPTGTLSRFMLRGKKTQGLTSSSGSRAHLTNQASILNFAKNPTPKFDPRPYVDELWLRLLDRAAEHIYDEEIIKEAVEDYADDEYEEKANHEQLLDNKIERLKKWVVFMNTTNPTKSNLLSGLTQASSMAIKDVLYFQNDIVKDRLNRRKSRPFYPDRYNKLKTVKKVLKRRYQKRFLENLKAEKLTTTYTNKYSLNRTPSRTVRDALQSDLPDGFWTNVVKPLNKRLPLGDPYPPIVDFIVRPIKTVLFEITDRFIKPGFWLVTKPARVLLRGPEDPDFYYWLKREEAFELEEDVLLELDQLRRRMPKSLSWGARTALWRKQAAEKAIPKGIKKLLSTQEGRELYTAKGFAERKERIAKERAEEDKQMVADIPKERQQEHIDDYRWVQELAVEYRKRQKREMAWLQTDFIPARVKAIDYYLKRQKKLDRNRDFMTQEEIAQEEKTLSYIKRDPHKWLDYEKLQKRYNPRIFELERKRKFKEAFFVWVDKNRERKIIDGRHKKYKFLAAKVGLDGSIIDPEVTMKVGRPVRIMGDIPWFSAKDEPPQGSTFEIQVPLSVYRLAGGDLTNKRDIYEKLRAQRAQRYRQWDRKRMRAVQAEYNEEFPSEDPPSLLDRIGDIFTGGLELDEDPLGEAVPVDFEYGTLSLADTNEEFMQERNLRKLQLLDEYTEARKSGDAKTKAKAKEMQEKVLRSVTGRPNLKLEDSFVPLQDDEPAQFEVEGEMNWWEEHRWPTQAENEESMLFHPATTQTEYERIADETYREAKRQDLHRWWWQEFLPQLRNQDYAKAYGRTDRKQAKALLIAGQKNLLEAAADVEQVKELSPEDYSQIGGLKFLGNRDYKPLQTPQGSRVLSDVINRYYDENKNKETYETYAAIDPSPLMRATAGKLMTSSGAAPNPTQWVSSTPAPFYVGWDETARQFVVTNRYLSREQSGYQMNWDPNFPIFSRDVDRSLSPDNSDSDTLTFSKYPLKGLAATITIYNKVYFASYDADQFFNLGLDGFSPVGWRKFKFRHTAPRVQPLLVHSVETSNDFSVLDKKRPFANLVQNYVTPSVTGFKPIAKEEQGDEKRDEVMELDSIHSHPQAPPYFPSGPLLTDTLPVHYVFTLYQRYRLPKERYADIAPNGVADEEDEEKYNVPGEYPGGKMDDFTLRKRVMPQRKYHSKPRSLTEEELLPSRRSFRGKRGDQRQRRPGTYPSEGNLAARVKEADGNRMRNLRRRVLRKTQRPQLRYTPLVGGFVWPGDALHLEQVEGSLVTTPEEREQQKQQLIAEGRPVPETLDNPEDLVLPLWQPQAREIFIKEHNQKVLKRRLERTQNKAQYYQKLKLQRLQAQNMFII